MRQGGEFDARTGKGKGFQRVLLDTPVSSADTGNNVSYFVSFSDSSSKTQTSLESNLDLQANMLLSSAKAGVSFDTSKLVESSEAALTINYYVETPAWRYEIRPKLIGANKTYPAISDYDKLKAEYHNLYPDRLEEFYAKYGTHVIVGWRKAYSISISGEGSSNVDRFQSHLDLYENGSYHALDFKSRLTRFEETLKSSQNLRFQYTGNYVRNGELPDIPNTIEELTSDGYRAKLNKYLSDLRDNGEKGKPASVNSLPIGGAVEAICVPYSEILEEPDDPGQPVPDSLERDMLNRWIQLEGLIRSLSAINADSNLGFMQPKDRIVLPAVIKEAIVRKNQIAEWLHELANGVTFQRSGEIEQSFATSMGPLPLIHLPALALQPHNYAWHDGTGVYATVVVPKGPFFIRTNKMNGTIATPYETLDVLGSDGDGTSFYKTFKHDNMWGVDDDVHGRSVVAMLVKHFGNPDKYIGLFRIDLILNDHPDTVVSSVYLTFNGQGG